MDQRFVYSFVNAQGLSCTAEIRQDATGYKGIVKNYLGLIIHEINTPSDFPQVLQEICEAIRALR